ENRGHGITLGAADEQIGQCEGAGNNSYRSSVVKVLVRLAADPMALAAPASYRHSKLFSFAGLSDRHSTHTALARVSIRDFEGMNGEEASTLLLLVQSGEADHRVRLTLRFSVSQPVQE